MHKINTESIYWKRYIVFIESRIERNIDPLEYVEIHHIIPKCAGGTNESSNLIKLTVREHFIAHWMLSYVGIGDVWYKLRFAFGCMSRYSKSNEERGRLTSRQFAISKKIRKETLVSWTKLTNPMKGKVWYQDEEGNSYRLNSNSPLIEEMSLTKRSPTKGKRWYTDGINFFMFLPTDPVVISLKLIPGSPGKGKKKNLALETKLEISEDRKSRVWYNNGIQSFKLKPNDPKIESLSLVRGRLFTEEATKNIKKGAAWKRTAEDNKRNSDRQQNKHRYNDGIKNYTLSDDDPKILELSLIRGVIVTLEGANAIAEAISKRDNSYIIGKKWFNNGSENFRLPLEEGKAMGLTLGKIQSPKKI